MGAAYYYGCLDTGPSYELAYKWFLEAAQNGNPWAQLFVGEMLYCGQGIEQSHREAARWFEASSDRGIAAATSNLGYMTC